MNDPDGHTKDSWHSGLAGLENHTAGNRDPKDVHWLAYGIGHYNDI